MPKFRFVTPHRAGKWYTDLKLAQRFAETIGAGFLDMRSGRFFSYPGTVLEVDGPAGSGFEIGSSETRDELR